MENNYTVIEFEALPENQSFARAVSAAYCAQLDPTAVELAEIRTAVSEAVSNAIIHGYERKGTGRICMELSQEEESRIVIKVSDSGKGIGDIAKAMEPLFSSEEEREMSGMGFTVMESFADKVYVESEPGAGTTVTLIKNLDTWHDE